MLEILRSKRFRNSPETKYTGNIFMFIGKRNLHLPGRLLVGNEMSASLCLKKFEFLVLA
jgi:hypothetical protein